MTGNPKSDRKKIKITIFGSMGWLPVQNRHTCCYCLEYKDHLFIFDAGTGMARLAEPAGQSILDKYKKVYILLSHYHLDHIAGLIYLPHLFRGREVKVHISGPGKPLYPKGMKRILSDIIAPPYFAHPLEELPLDIRFHELGIGSCSIDGIPIDTIRQEHSDPTIGIRIDHSTCYITDTSCSEATVEFSRGCHLLLHEAWWDMEDYQRLKTQQGAPSSGVPDPTLQFHAHAECVARLASRAGVDFLLLIHLNPSYDEKRLSAMESFSREIFPHTFLAMDGQSFKI